MRIRIVVFSICAATVLAAVPGPTVLGAAEEKLPEQTRARQILATTGIEGGLVVHLGCGDGKLTAALRDGDRYLVHGLDADAGDVERARRYIQSLGIYGPVSADRLDGEHLPYVDNLVNLVVAEDFGGISMDEIVRVLAPEGAAYVKTQTGWTKRVKPRPKEIDEWTHHLHGPDGNPVAEDWVVGPPKHYQWIAGPLWQRAHDTDSSLSALVSGGGRIFYMVDEGPISLPGDHPLPDKWFLAARDAFNGVLLWKVPVEHWGWREWKPYWFKRRPGNFPINLHRRVVAAADRVYATLGYHAPVSRLDAATGKVLRTYQGTEDTREILYRDGLLILSLFRQGRLKLAVVDAETADVLWKTKESYGGSTTEYIYFDKRMPKIKLDPVLSAAVDGEVVCFLDGREIVCLDFKTGEQRWRAKVEGEQSALWVGTLIVHKGVVLYANPEKLVAFSAETGGQLWSQPKRNLGWLWFQWKDVFVIRGLVWTWSAECGRPERPQKGNPWPLYVNGYDLRTGKLEKQIDLGGIFKTIHHHRCYRNKATPRYILASRRGTEFVDLETGKHTVYNWVRGTCHYGMMPANGLQYAPPHPCRCYIDEKLNGMNALAASTTRPVAEGPAQRNRLEKGPAYAKVPQGKSRIADPEDWPAFRHDAMCSGSTPTAVPGKVTPLWSVDVGGRVSPPTIAAGKVFVASIDEHRVVALDAENGKTLWQFVAGGRVDSPPTYYRGAVLFGSADGRVYCVDAADGKPVWRFRAAPDDRRIGAFGQLESAWPVHGSILVHEGAAYFAAGRSSFLDGGIYLFGLDPKTGEPIHEARVEGPRIEFDDFVDNFSPVQGALSDVLHSDGEDIYMRHLRFDAGLARKSGPAKLRALGGLLDDTYFKRAFWYYGDRANWGQLLVHDQRSAYIVRMFDSPQILQPHLFFTPGKEGYRLFAQDRGQKKPRWSVRVPIRIRTMVACGEWLFVAGPPDVVDRKDPLGAFEGRQGGILRAISTASGETLEEYLFKSPPVFNGLAAAGGRLYLVTADGKVGCMAGR